MSMTRDRARRVVVGAVEHLIAIGAFVIVVRGNDHHFLFELGVAALHRRATMLRSGTMWRLTRSRQRRPAAGNGRAQPPGRATRPTRDRSSSVRFVPRIRIDASAGEICAAGMRICRGSRRERTGHRGGFAGQ